MKLFYLTIFKNKIILSMKCITSYTGGNMKDKFIGVCKVGEKGQIVIPKEARDMFNISPGDSIVVLADKNRGIAILKADTFESSIDGIMEANNVRN